MAQGWGARPRLRLIGREPLLDERPEALVVLVVDVAVRLPPGEVVAEDLVRRIHHLRMRVTARVHGLEGAAERGGMRGGGPTPPPWQTAHGIEEGDDA